MRGYAGTPNVHNHYIPSKFSHNRKVLMPIKHIVSDWNGTLISHRDEFHLYSKIALDLGKAQLWNGIPVHLIKLLQLYRMKNRMEKMYALGRTGNDPDFVEKMYSIFNNDVVLGLPVSFIHRSVDNYAARASMKLDLRLIRPLEQASKEGTSLGILSAGYGLGIRRTLEEAGLGNLFDPSDTIADVLEEKDGRAVGFHLRIYKNKLTYLKTEFFGKRQLKDTDTAYLGDTTDDESCFEYLASVGGYPIVPILASNDFKNHCVKKYNAFVPESEKDFLLYLKSAT